MRRAITIDNLERILNSRRMIDLETGCWLYTEKLNGLYGRMRFDYKDRYVHCLSAMLYLGYDLDSEFLVLHKPECPNKHCFNPMHLYIGTQEQNVKDAIEAGKHISVMNASKTYCHNGHEFTPENTYIDKRGCRGCVICRKDNELKWTEAKKR